MGIVGTADQVLRIIQDRVVISQLLQCYRIHMMYIDMSSDLPSRNTEIIPFIPDDDPFPHIIPFGSMIEFLIQIPCVSEQLLSDITIKFQI